MKKVFLVLTAVVFLSVSTPAHAAWYDWFVGAKKEAPIEIRNQSDSKSDTAQVVPIKPESTQSVKNQSAEIESLKAEVTSLKASLDSLYKAHNGLVEDHNALLKYVNSTMSSSKNVGATVNNSNLETEITTLDKKIDTICSHIFSSLGGFGTKCPSSSAFTVGGTLESRIKKLESGL